MKNTITNTTETKQKGRPANPNSARQMKIQDRNAKREAGLLKRGRPVIEGSKRQEIIKKRNEKVSNGIELKKGRPVNVNSKRQVALAKKNNSDVVELERG
jgi:hypothetical protein